MEFVDILERTGSEDSLCSENVYYIDHEKHGQSSEKTYFHDLAHQQIEGHINTSTDVRDSFRPVQLKCKEEVVIKPAIHIENTRITTPTVPINVRIPTLFVT
uniref:Uncharacterized protein n=1 Tax=Heterorhabditis bacteriophora TaxID=37862 RepID=A0A1I7XBS5_HETBA